MNVVQAILYEVDWAAISTIVLTAITGYYAWSTRQILAATARQANAAEENVRLLLLERTGRVEQLVGPIRNVVDSGLSVATQWAGVLGVGATLPRELAPLEPDGFFECVALARSVSHDVHDKLRHVQDRIVDVRVAFDAARIARRADGDERRNLSGAVERLRSAWQDVGNELDRRIRA